MSKDIPKRVRDITGIELMSGNRQFVLEMERKALNAVAMNVTTVCFAILISIQRIKVLARITFVFDDRIKKVEELVKFIDLFQ